MQPGRSSVKRHVRHQSDVVRVLVGFSVLVVSAVLARRGEPSVVEVNLFRLVNQLPGVLSALFLGAMQLGALGAVPVVSAVALLGRRRSLARLLLGAGFAAWALARLMQAVVGQEPPEVVLTGVVFHGSAAPGLAFPATHVAVAAAMATIAGPYLSRSAGRLAWAAVVGVALSRIYNGAHLPVDVAGGAALGWAVGAIVHLAAGAPRGRVSAQDAEVSVAAIWPGAIAVECEVRTDPGAGAYRSRCRDGSAVLIKIVGRDQPDADWLYRAWRLVAFREPEDRASIVSPGHRVAHEAHLTLLAQREGVTVPALLATGGGDDEHLLVRSWVEGRTLQELDPAEVTCPLLADLWHQVALLHRAGLSHGSLRTDHVVLDSRSRPCLVELGLGRATTDAEDRARDVAELMASLAARVPPHQVVATAAQILGEAVVAGAVPLLQPLTLSTVTRRRVAVDVLTALRATASQVGHVMGPAPQTPTRAALRNLLPWAGLGFATYIVLPQVGQAKTTLVALQGARWGWLVPMAGASALTYLMAAVALLGASGLPLALGRTWAVQVAAAFTNRLAPAGLGGMGTNMRYLQAAGSDRAGAATAVGLNSLAGFLVHATGVAAVIPLLGSAGGARRLPSAPDLPDHWPLLVGVVGALAGIGLLLWGSRLGHLALPGIRSARKNLFALGSHPRRAAALFGGSAGVTAGYALALVAAMQAFGGGLAPVKIVAVYLGASALAAVAPTPGGLGALEAALVAGLTGLGAPTGQSVAAVVVYRLITYWAPVVPGMMLFRRLRRQSLL